MKYLLLVYATTLLMGGYTVIYPMLLESKKDIPITPVRMCRVAFAWGLSCLVTLPFVIWYLIAKPHDLKNSILEVEYERYR